MGSCKQKAINHKFVQSQSQLNMMHEFSKTVSRRRGRDGGGVGRGGTPRSSCTYLADHHRHTQTVLMVMMIEMIDVHTSTL